MHLPGNDKSFIQSWLRYSALTSYRDANRYNERNLSEEEHTVLNNLIKNKDSVMPKVDKGNTLVTLNKNVYISKMETSLKYTSKFWKFFIQKNNVLNYVLHMENRIIDVLKKLKNNKKAPGQN